MSKRTSDLQRRLRFSRGYGDGASLHSIKHEDEPDYMEGWKAGRRDARLAADRFRVRYALPHDAHLRAQATQ